MPPQNTDFALPSVNAGAPGYADIIKTLSAPRAGQTDILPQLQEILSGRSQFIEPQIGALSADIQGAMGKRGLTGSSIEAQAIASGTGQARAQFALGGATQFAELVARAQAGDVEAQRQMITFLSQAMGQELTAGRSQANWEREMAAMLSEGEASRKSARESAIIGGISNIFGSVSKGIFS